MERRALAFRGGPPPACACGVSASQLFGGVSLISSMRDHHYKRVKKTCRITKSFSQFRGETNRPPFKYGFGFEMPFRVF
ncbi:hypothetical protein RCO48_04380 [Peribacillus frigoritolerans]|nr:hypothetical protein [Peribacillus frigoritolerans]